MFRHFELGGVAGLMVHTQNQVCMYNWVWTGNTTIPRKRYAHLSYFVFNLKRDKQHCFLLPANPVVEEKGRGSTGEIDQQIDQLIKFIKT